MSEKLKVKRHKRENGKRSAAVCHSLFSSFSLQAILHEKPNTRSLPKCVLTKQKNHGRPSRRVPHAAKWSLTWNFVLSQPSSCQLDAIWSFCQHGVALVLRWDFGGSGLAAHVEAHQENGAQSQEWETAGFHQQQPWKMWQTMDMPHEGTTLQIKSTIEWFLKFWNHVAAAILQVFPNHTLPVGEMKVSLPRPCDFPTGSAKLHCAGHIRPRRSGDWEAPPKFPAGRELVAWQLTRPIHQLTPKLCSRHVSPPEKDVQGQHCEPQAGYDGKAQPWEFLALHGINSEWTKKCTGCIFTVRGLFATWFSDNLCFSALANCQFPNAVV